MHKQFFNDTLFNETQIANLKPKGIEKLATSHIFNARWRKFISWSSSYLPLHEITGAQSFLFLFFFLF